MNILLVDIGNTRAKWAVLKGTHITAARAVVHAGKPAALQRLVRALPRVQGAVAVSVAGPKLERALAAALRSRFGIATQYIRSTRSAAGVRNAYRDTWRLGADRWVGVVAAHALLPRRPALVVNIGTALTVDLVSADGLHLGGAIVPGPSTMIASLLAGTHGIRRRARGARGAGRRPRSVFAADTASALEAGALFAAAAFIDRALQEARQALGAKPVLLLAGGAAGALQPYIKSAVRAVPDLVLLGLAVFATARGK
jgi:type III pantothenate kinase